MEVQQIRLDQKKREQSSRFDIRITRSLGLRLIFRNAYKMLHAVDHSTDRRGVVVDRDVVRTTEAERLDGALVILERVVDAARLRDIKLLGHDRNPC